MPSQTMTSYAEMHCPDCCRQFAMSTYSTHYPHTGACVGCGRPVRRLDPDTHIWLNPESPRCHTLHPRADTSYPGAEGIQDEYEDEDEGVLTEARLRSAVDMLRDSSPYPTPYFPPGFDAFMDRLHRLTSTPFKDEPEQ
jgi:hypothetical protein